MVTGYRQDLRLFARVLGADAPPPAAIATRGTASGGPGCGDFERLYDLPGAHTKQTRVAGYRERWVTMSHRKDEWASGDAYEPYVGRWSRLVGPEFVRWLGLPGNRRWLDVGCGTGALSQAILARSSPSQVVGVDPSEGYLAHARAHVVDARVSFRIGDAQALPVADGEFDVAVAGLVLNFVPDKARAVTEMRRSVGAGGTVAAYVWDYAGEMQLMRHFWDAAVALDPGARELDEGRRFPIAKPGPLSELFEAAGLDQVRTRAIDVPTVFRDFDDYWSPFLGGQGPAPGYCVSLPEERRVALRERIQASLPIQADGTIPLIARAWAVRGTRPR